MNQENKAWMAYGALFAGIAVILGAMGAHMLRETFHLEERYLNVFETGVRYQFFHAIGLILLGIIADRTSINLTWVARLFMMGIGIFCLSLYFLAVRSLIGLDNWGWVGAVTPLGGLSLIAGWLLLAYRLFKSKP